MYPLSAQRALEAWERGQRSDSIERSLVLLSSALPNVRRDRLGKLPLGQRDALLMRLRERTFGSQVRGFAQCPKCNTRLEFPLDLRAYDSAAALARRLAPETLSAEGFEVRFRLPDSGDLAAMSRCRDVEGARHLLLERCVLEASHGGEPVPVGELPEVVVERVGERMEALDPLAYLPLSIDCARCGHDWMILLDPGSLLWREIASTAERLLQEVHALARAYGWSESEILAMSDARRRFYLAQLAPPEGGGLEGAP